MFRYLRFRSVIISVNNHINFKGFGALRMGHNQLPMGCGFREFQQPRKTTSTPSLSVQASIATNFRDTFDYDMHEFDSNDTEDMMEESYTAKKH